MATTNNINLNISSANIGVGGINSGGGQMQPGRLPLHQSSPCLFNNITQPTNIGGGSGSGSGSGSGANTTTSTSNIASSNNNIGNVGNTSSYLSKTTSIGLPPPPPGRSTSPTKFLNNTAAVGTASAPSTTTSLRTSSNNIPTPSAPPATTVISSNSTNTNTNTTNNEEVANNNGVLGRCTTAIKSKLTSPPVTIAYTFSLNIQYLLLSFAIVTSIYILSNLFHGWIPWCVLALIVNYIFLCTDGRFHLTANHRLPATADGSRAQVAPKIKEKINFYQGAIDNPPLPKLHKRSSSAGTSAAPVTAPTPSIAKELASLSSTTSDDSITNTYRTRQYDTYRRSLPPEYYNQYLHYLNSKGPTTARDEHTVEDLGSSSAARTDHQTGQDDQSHSCHSSETSDTEEHPANPDQTAVNVELSELANISKVKSNISHFTKLSTNLEEKLDWVQSPFNLTPARASHSIAVYGQSIVTVGGEGVTDISNIVQFIDIENGVATTPKVTGGKIGPDSIHMHDFCRIGNKFYIFGGIVNGALSNKVYMFSVIDDSTIHWSQPRVNSYLPAARYGHTLTRYGNKFILFGGFNGETCLNDLHLLDPETMTWSQLVASGLPPTERYGHSTTVLGEKMIVFGGTNNSRDLNDVNILQLDTNSWSAPPNFHGQEVPPERSFHAAARVGRNLIVVGGRKEGVTQRDVWSLSYKLQWTRVTGQQITPRSNHGLVKNESKLFIVGGKNQNGGLLDDVWFVNTTNLPITASVSIISYSDIKIEKEIGKGHFSKVLRGIWKQKEVAVKKLNLVKDKGKEEMMTEFKAEVELLGTLQHPNLVACYGYCLNPMCIVMEYLPTGNLYDLIHSRDKQLDSALILQFAFEIARGMQFLHSRNIIHRDLKSSNLLLDKHFNIKIADLGIARETTFTQTMTTIGTVAWTAPEILRHESYNNKADVYSYALVLWELLSGEEPYAGIPAMNAGILVASKGLRPDIPEKCDPNWKKLVVWCWAEDPNKRPSFEEITTYLTKTF
ncbi:hypothetical protein SAMD00019534_033510 [Acytostelium subglobosum LB1]|uniref:hypothetical protein n=1 Tax=Acytostelium subglobosum LB1 TaxID=1410327 RepID=UPI000644F136|nr:hypothetical protein SAMD00019534_033510 [Acytostelium subglobosum LB1]GAM20176.1 hypothetical protein SAMD00019534_033510 [Acytostelium subglobosum LB1]|eukprot:XP_012759697.1 hypothetical protein SAMD00019534_033510 [Acytostelium subglobosum LB1]